MNDRCEHGILWSAECLSCPPQEYVAATPPTTPSDAAMRAAEVREVAKEVAHELDRNALLYASRGDRRLSDDELVSCIEIAAAIITRHLAATASDKETPMNTVTFGDSKNIANPDVSCQRCGGTKPTYCSCPEPKQFPLPEFAREFTQAAINAHVGFKHETRWHDCNYASCAKWREMIDTLNAAAATTSPETPRSLLRAQIRAEQRKAAGDCANCGAPIVEAFATGIGYYWYHVRGLAYCDTDNPSFERTATPVPLAEELRVTSPETPVRGEHVDFVFDNMPCWKVCGLVRPAEGWTRPCKGPSELSLRAGESQ